MDEDFQYNRVRDKANEIEAELKRLNCWLAVIQEKVTTKKRLRLRKGYD